MRVGVHDPSNQQPPLAPCRMSQPTLTQFVQYWYCKQLVSSCKTPIPYGPTGPGASKPCAAGLHCSHSSIRHEKIVPSPFALSIAVTLQYCPDLHALEAPGILPPAWRRSCLQTRIPSLLASPTRIVKIERPASCRSLFPSSHCSSPIPSRGHLRPCWPSHILNAVCRVFASGCGAW